MVDSWVWIIRRFRSRHGLSQTKLAEMLGVGQRTVSRWERGQDRPSTAHQRVLRDLCRVENSDLLRSLSNTIAFCPVARAISVMPKLRLVALSPPAISKRPSVRNLIGQNLAPLACGVLEQMLDDRALQRGIASGDVLGVTSVTRGVLKTEEQPIAGTYRTTICYFRHDGTLFSDAIGVRTDRSEKTGYWPIHADELIVDDC